MPVARVSVADLLQAVEDRLLAFRVVAAANSVVWSVRAHTQTSHTNARKELLLKVGRVVSVQPTNDGGGRRDTRLRRLLHVYVRTTSLLGGGLSEKEWVKNHFPFEDAVLDALQDFHPEDSAGNVLMIEPMRLTEASDPDREAQQAAWGDTIATFEMLYLPNIQATDEPVSPSVSA